MGKKKKMKRVSLPDTLLREDAYRKQKTFFCIFIFIAAFLLYSNTIRHGYAFDDSVAITGNKFTKMGIAGIPHLLTKDFFEGIYDKALELGGGRYRPLSLVTFAIEYQFFGENPHVSHFINVLLYAFTGIALFLTLLTLLDKQILTAGLTTLVFIFHPVHTEVVANIKSRDEILAFLFLILSVRFFLLYSGKNKLRHMVIAQILYFFSLFSKEVSITWLAVFPLLPFLFRNHSFKDSFRKSIPFLLTGLIFIVIRSGLVGMVGDRMNTDIMENPFVNANAAQKYATILVILLKYLSLLVFPHPLSSDYSYNQIPLEGWTSPSVLLSAAVYGFLIYYCAKYLSGKNIIAFSIYIFLLPLLLVSNLFFNVGAPMADRFLYLPSLGFSLAFSKVLIRIFRIQDLYSFAIRKPLFYAFTSLITLSCTAKTITRNRDWKDNETLFGRDVNSAPNSAKIHYYYGNVILTQLLGNREEMTPERMSRLNLSRKHTLQAAAINPAFHHAHYNLGLIYQELNMADSALFHLHRVLEIQPTHILTQSALGSVYGKLKGDTDKAVHYLEIAVKFDPQNNQAWENLGIAYGQKGLFSQALDAFSRSLSIRPDNAVTYLNMAITYQNMGKQEKADECFNKAFALDPSLKKK